MENYYIDKWYIPEPIYIVKCKDCIHRPKLFKSVILPNIDMTCPFINSHYIPEDDFYCAFGEKEY